MRSAISLALLMAVPAAALQAQVPAQPTPYQRAIAAGYKAAMLCSGIFNAGRTRAQVEADELQGIYPEYQPIIPTLVAEILPAGIVTVAFDALLPPRRAAWRPSRGCTLDPIGAHILPPLHGPLVRDKPGPAPAHPHPWPLGDMGIAPRPAPALESRIAAAFDGRTYGKESKTAGIVVLRDGRIVAERYACGFGPFTSNRTWSVAKSMTGTLVGMVVAGRTLDPSRGNVIPEWRVGNDPRSAITLDQMLRMATGLHTDGPGNRTDLVYFGGGAIVEDATHWPIEVAPGTRFRYSNTDTLLVVRAMHAQLGVKDYADWPARSLFQPLGMRHTVAETDRRGDYILSSQVWSTARDLARLGQFWLQDGVWQGKRLLPEGWMRYMLTPSGPQPASGPGYGATLWLFGPEQGLPEGSYAAQGNRGQYVMVIPSERLVIVRRGEDPSGARFDIAKFTADVIGAVR